MTFLFTDVEGSSRLLDRVGVDAYRDAVAAHRRVLREVFARNGGVEVDTQGDGFFVAFARASDAVAGAREAQAALRDGAVAVRMGIHTGEPLLADDDYFGIDVHRAARIAAAGSGGQVLLSQATRTLTDAEVKDLGDHRLKDLSAPERIYQLGHGEFPRLKTLYQTNLPIQSMPLVGRERELAEIVSLLGTGIRMLTLTGPGGSGKTRLALHAAAELADAFPDGVWFVSLAPLADPTLVAPTIAHVLDTNGDLGRYLRDKQLLLLLDNFEQVLDAAADVGAALAQAPGVRVLATSRERLHLSMEREYPVPVLAVADAAALFVERARRLDDRVEPSGDVRKLVAALDCLPLAVELAAARIKVVSPAEMRKRLNRSLDLLTGGDRDLPERQRTLRATIEWSYQLLEPDERGAFAALSVFPATFSADAAERVAAADIDRLGSLLDKSLLERALDGRFSMLATIREYACTRLEASRREPIIRTAHAECYLALAELHREEIEAGNPLSLDRFELEHDNFRAALSWLETSGDVERQLRLSADLAHFWYLHAHLVEGRRHLEQALRGGRETAARAHALRVLSIIAVHLADAATAEEAAADAVALYETLGDETGRAAALLASANAAMLRGDPPTARAKYSAAAAIFRRLPNMRNVRGAAAVANNLAYAALLDEDESAITICESAVAQARNTNAAHLEASALLNLSFAHVHRGDPEAATIAAAQAAEIAVPHGLRAQQFYCVEAFAAAAAAIGNGETAARLLAAADAARSMLGLTLDPFEAKVEQEARERARASVTAEAFEAAWEAGRTLPLQNALAFALDPLTQPAAPSA